MGQENSLQKMAVEILRRILGLAQLPLEIDLEHRKELVLEARGNLVSWKTGKCSKFFKEFSN